MGGARRLTAAVIATAALALFACAKPHVTLSVPRATDSIEARRTAYLRLRPVQIERTIRTGPRSGNTVSDVITLTDGTQVHHFDDLLPVLSPNTPAAVAVRKSQRLRKKSQLYYAATAGALLAGFLVWGTSDSSARETAGYAFILGGAGLALVGYLYQSESDDKRWAAFRALDESLRTTLYLCLDEDERIIDCRDAGPAGTTPVPRDPY